MGRRRWAGTTPESWTHKGLLLQTIVNTSTSITTMYNFELDNWLGTKLNPFVASPRYSTSVGG